MQPMKSMVDPSSDHLSRGDAFERDGHYAEAAEAYRAAVGADPFDADARARHQGDAAAQLSRGGAHRSLYPFGWPRCQFHAVSTIPRSSV